MKPRTNNDVLELMNQFLDPIREEKRASEEINEIKADSGKPQTEEVDKGEGRGQGAAGSEKREDIEKEDATTKAQAPAAAVEEGDSDQYADDAGTKSLDSEEKVTQESVTKKKTENPEEDNDANDKGETGGHHQMATQKQAIARNAILANRILEAINVEKTASAGSTPTGNMSKEAALQKAAEQSYQEYVGAYVAGVRQRESDVASLVKEGMNEKQANELLDKVAMEDPAAVLPAEAIPPEIADEVAGVEEGGTPPEGAPEMDEEAAEQLAAELEAAGVTTEDLEQAVALTEELTAQGVSPEEITQAVMEMAEEAPAEEAPAEEAPVEEAPVEEAPVEETKEASEKEAARRISAVKDFIRANANK